MMVSCRGALLLCLTLLFTAPALAIEGQMVVHHDGTTTTLTLDDVRSLAWNETNGVVITADEVYSYPIANLEKITFENLVDVGEETTGTLPTLFELQPAYPNPFNSTVTVPFSLPESGTLRLRLVNLLGQTVYLAEAVQQAGRHRVVIDLSGNSHTLASGVYLLRAEFNGQIQSSKLVFMK